MSDERKKFTLYLHPDQPSDAQALAVIETVPRAGRGELYRNALVAGLALQHLDSRLPTLLTTLFTDKLTSDNVVNMISQTTGWKPSQADIRAILAELGAGQISSEPNEKKLAEELDLNAARSKLKGFL
ncbi:plasmid partitioning/stability family protein [Hafnia alvei]|uniref:plasmid partitioning/stability family protein n=1 Tax=Hafnia alvei TaxID=569 RepID=UPI00242CEED9|nr:plasmid partitioning/stability family protein [Hafnia alvei]